MSFRSTVPRPRAPKLRLRLQQTSSLPTTYTRSSSCDSPSSNSSSHFSTSSTTIYSSPRSSSRSLLATDTAELDSWGLATRKTSSSKESLQVSQ